MLLLNIIVFPVDPKSLLCSGQTYPIALLVNSVTLQTFNYLTLCNLLQARQSHQRLRVVRIETTTDKQRIVGLFVPNAAVESVLQGLSRSHILLYLQFTISYLMFTLLEKNSKPYSAEACAQINDPPYSTIKTQQLFRPPHFKWVE